MYIDSGKLDTYIGYIQFRPKILDLNLSKILNNNKKKNDQVSIICIAHGRWYTYDFCSIMALIFNK